MILHLSHIFLTDGLTFIINSFTRQIGKAALATMTLRPLRQRARHAGAASMKTASLFIGEAQHAYWKTQSNAYLLTRSGASKKRTEKNRYESDKPLTTHYPLVLKNH